MQREAWTPEELISSPRLQPYHHLEVGLRNALDGVLVLESGVGTQWMEGSSVLLSPASLRRVRQARDRARVGGAPVTHGKVVAELTFGFWWSLLADEYNRSLWQPFLRFAFDGPVRRRRLHAELDALRTLRNRIAHHEPIHRRDLAADFARLCDTAGRVADVLRLHIERSSRVPELLVSRPGLG